MKRIVFLTIVLALVMTVIAARPAQAHEVMEGNPRSSPRCHRSLS